ncbi:MAG: LuxR C-terminal-related transcriptional regulator [Actinomycetota bacterium]|nr:LuxR C-terminal-related transcriptional regulator [Actinomycetota bacterium]
MSDIEGSTRLWEGDAEVLGTAITRHHELLNATIALHGGVRPVKRSEGDSVVGVFARPSDALAAALDAQRAFDDEPWAEGRALRIRLALHTGQAQLRGNDYVGRAVIRCAQLRAIAHGGQTVLSGVTRDLVADRLPDRVSLRDLGSHRLKDLGQPERVWQVCHPELVNEFPPLRSLDAIVNNLPTQLTSFVGREVELAELRRAFDAAQLVTLTGAGGCGKTRLALHAVAEVAQRHPDGVWWVELAPVSAADTVPYVVARTFGLVEEQGRPIVDTLSEQLAGFDALVILDNCEHVLEPCARLVEALLQAVPALQVVVTSREPLGVPGELTWRVPSLDEEAAARLFVERAALVRPGFTADGDDAEVVGQICQRLDGLPLAIELAAARVRMMPPAGIAAALDDRFRLLTGGGRTVLPRQRALETSVAWSHDLLDDAERALLRRLSVFAGGFTLDAAESVCADEIVDRYAVLDVLSRLVDKSLVQADVDRAEGRYGLLETIRFFARGRLVDARESDPTRERHRDFFLALAERAEPELFLAGGPAWLDRLERERDNLRAAAEWCDATGAYEPFLRLVTALTLFYELHSHLQAGGRWFAQALARDEGPSPLRARALWGAAHVALYGGDFESMGRYAPQALEMAEEVGDEWAIGRALNTNGVVAGWLRPEPEQARVLLQRSITLGQKLGDHWAVAAGRKMMTAAWMVQDDYQGLAPALAELRRVAEHLRHPYFIAWYHTIVGWAGLHQGQFATAERALETALEYDREVGGASTAGIAMALLGEIESLTGRYDAAEARLGPFLKRAAATGDYLGAPWGVPALASLLVGRGAPADARGMVEPFVELLRPLGAPLHVSHGLWVLGAAHLATGDLEAAEAALIEAKELATVISNPWLAAHANHHLGELARRRDDPSQAEDLHHEALALRVRAGLRPGVAESLESLAALATDQESFSEAARLFGAASALRAEIGLARWPADQAGYDTDVARARDAGGEQVFDVAWAEGEALTVDEAVAYVSRARGERKRPSSGWASLTPTEIEVVKLVAKGLTNPEVGERLFIGRGTVKTHLAHVFAKLGIATRSELAAEAARRAL